MDVDQCALEVAASFGVGLWFGACIAESVRYLIFRSDIRCRSAKRGRRGACWGGVWCVLLRPEIVRE